MTQPGVRTFAGTTRFEPLRALGEGGMGTVYEVRDRARGVRLALKVLRATAPDALLQLKTEFRALQTLRHPNVIRFGELLEEDGRWFFTMELVEGVDLLRWVRPEPELEPLDSAVSGTRPMEDGGGETGGDESPPPPVPRRFDEARLRSALAQLARGLGALHAAGNVHRDVKPANVLVSHEGRVVLVDFGLAADVASLAPRAARPVGTRAFMAPELAAGGAPSAASDWYALGVVLHQALTGTVPFRGAEMDRRRAHAPAPPVQRLCPDAPPDLCWLCDELLALDPAMRPSGDQVLGRLGVEPGSVGPSPIPRFVGRTTELAALREAFARSRAETTSALVVGESGLGKTTLARTLVEGLRAGEPAIAVLGGRCYEREIVPFNAFDGVVDELSEVLRGAGREVDALLTDDAALLARLFPVLRRVPSIAAMPSPAPASLQDLRTRACSALRAILGHLARARPLIVHLDDLQWADADSLWLLGELFAAETSPPLLLLATLRAPSPRVARVLSRLPGARRLELGPLDESAARRWAAELVGSAEDGRLADAVVEEAAGHPFFLVELADYVKRAGAGALGGGRLDRALWSRVDRLDPPAARLVEVLAIAGAPLLADVAAAAAGLDAGSYADCAAALSMEHLAHASDAHGRERIEPYHDRVREAVLAHLPPSSLRAGHLRLAMALERAGAGDAAQLGRHFADGGEPGRALGHVVRAAEEAGRVLALEESATLYQRALELQRQATAHEQPVEGLELAAAEALSAADHGREAARLFLRLASGATELRRIELQRRAVEELFTHGLLDEGYAVLDTVLPQLGLSVPRSKVAIFGRVLGGWLRNALVGHRLRVRAEPASERDLVRVDLLGGVTLSLWSMDPLMGAALQADHLRLALRSGDPLRAAFAVAMEAGASAVAGFPARDRTRRRLDEAAALARRQDEVPYWQASYAVVAGTVAVLECRWLDALESLDAAARELARIPLGHIAIRELMTNMRLTTLFWLGRTGDVLRQSPGLLRRAEERDNLDGWAWLQVFDVWSLACAGRPAEARARLALLDERLPARAFLLHRWYADRIRVVLLLCEGRGQEAFDAIRALEKWLRFEPAGQSQRVWTRWLLASAALERAQQVPGEQTVMLARARRAAARLAAERTPWVDGAVACVRASIASVEGQVDDAARALAEAEPLLATHHFEAHLACVRAARARLVGGEEGTALRAQADAWFAEQPFTPAARRAMLPGRWGE